MTRIAAAALVLAAAGCQSVDFLEIDPKEVVLKRKNDAVWVKCVGKNRAKHVIPKVQCAWSTADAAVAVVDKDGKLSGRGPGQTTVTAQAHGLSAEAIVRIESVERVEVEPKSITFAVGDEPVGLTIKAYTLRDRLLTDRTPEWKVLTPDTVAKADDKVWPHAPGEGKIRVYVDDVSLDVPVTVLAKGKKK